MRNVAVRNREVSLLDLLRILNHHRILLGAFVGIGIGAALLALSMIKPLYRAQSILLVAPIELAGNVDLVRDVEIGDANSIIETQVRILASRSLAEDVLKSPEFVGWSATDEHRWTWPWRQAGETASTAHDKAGRFLDGLTVARDGKSNAIKVSFVSTDAARAAAFANATVEQYFIAQLARKYEANQRTTAWLAEQVELAGAELEAAEAALSLFREKSSEAFADAAAVHGVDVVNLQRDLAAASAERAARQVKLERVKQTALNGEFAGEWSQVYEDIGGSPVLQNLFALKNQAIRREAELASQYGAQHPLIVDVRSEIRELSSRIYAERSAMIQRVTAELDEARVREATLKAELAKLNTQTLAKRDADNEIDALKQEVALSRTIYQDYVTRFQAAADQEFAQIPDGRVLSKAVSPTSPYFPNPSLMIAASIMAALATALLIIFLREQADRGFRTASEVEDKLGLPCLALVPELVRGRGDDIEPHDYVQIRPQSRLAEALRGLLATFDRQRDGGSVVLVASSMPGEGKSTTAVSLARVAANEGLRTVLIDADLRRPRVQVMLGEPLAAGLIEVLRGDVALDTALKRERGEGEPDILLGSRRSEAPVQVLGQEGMHRLLQTLRSRYDLILIDTAPVAAVSDARVLARYADSVLMLVRWNATPQALVEHSIRGLREAGATSVGCVLTQVDLKRHARAGSAEAHIASRQLAAYYSD